MDSNPIAWLERMELLTGPEAIQRLQNSRVLVVGLGGVGSFAVEFLARAGVGHLTIVDGDTVDPTNKNRQLPALNSTIGKLKASVMQERILDISPTTKVTAITTFQGPTAMEALLQSEFDFVLDCIDSLTPKIELTMMALRLGVPFIGSMGAGTKIDPSRVRIANILETHGDPLAFRIRKYMLQNQVNLPYPVVFSDEPKRRSALKLTDGRNYKKSFYGTISYMPALFGLHMAAYVICKLGEID